MLSEALSGTGLPPSYPGLAKKLTVYFQRRLVLFSLLSKFAARKGTGNPKES